LPVLTKAKGLHALSQSKRRCRGSHGRRAVDAGQISLYCVHPQDQSPGTRFFLLIDYWLLAVVYWLLAIGYWLLAIGYWLARVIKSDKEVVCFA
jgi:hypothetical protein